MTTDRSDAPIQDKAPGVARGFASGLVFVVAFSAENRKSTFPKMLFCVVAFSAENRKSTFPKMLRSEVAALEVAAQIEAHVRIGIGTEIVVVVVNRGALRRRTRLSLFAADRLVVLRGMLGGLDTSRARLCEGRRSDHGGERRHGK